jgi:tetratricopeptide (TPR) repeat protein
VLADGDEARTKQLYEKAAEQFEILLRKHGKEKYATPNAEVGLCAVYSGLNKWDQAISMCERIVQNPGRIDSNGSVYYNLAKAYLARKQTKKARERASDYAARRKNEARGFMLIGDTFFEDRDWNAALDQYLRAEKALKPNQQREQIQLSIKLGKTYRRLPAPAGAPTNPYLANAIEKLQAAQSANPDSIELAIELGGAYLEAKQDAKALAISDKLLTGTEIAKAPADQKAQLTVINAKALFNTDKLKESRDRFEEARKLRPEDVKIKRALITVINQQAFKEGKDYTAAMAFLVDAQKIDGQNTQTLRNMAVINIERDKCQEAAQVLQKLDTVKGRDAVVTQRLLGRAYLCLNSPKKANEAFTAAEREAKKANAQLLLAEIYTEWAPLTWGTDIETTVDRLEVAVNVGAQDPDIGPSAKRNFAIALYMRGWNSLKNGKGTEATADFERALRDPSVLRGNEPAAFEFSLGLAQLDAGRISEASKTFSRAAAKGNQSSYMKGAYAKDNGAFFTAYANYRSQTGTQRQNACEQLEKLSVTIGGRSKDIAAACYEAAAVDFYRAGSGEAARKALAKVETLGNASQKRRVNVDQAAMSLSRSNLQALESLNGDPPESLVNLGIIYDQMDKPREAYDAWVRAKAKGANAPYLQKWIEAKKRIYGY